MRFRFALAAASFALCAASANAETQFIVQAGGGYYVSNLTLGAAWPFAWMTTRFGGEWSASTELLANFWRARQAAGGRKSFVQLAAVPILRYRFDEGRSPLFLEAGIGVSMLNDLYTRDNKVFSTRFNFYDTLGAGVSFGAQRENEVGVRITHISNGAIKHPNPGENFMQLRYARRF